MEASKNTFTEVDMDVSKVSMMLLELIEFILGFCTFIFHPVFLFDRFSATIWLSLGPNNFVEYVLHHFGLRFSSTIWKCSANHSSILQILFQPRFSSLLLFLLSLSFAMDSSFSTCIDGNKFLSSLKLPMRTSLLNSSTPAAWTRDIFALGVGS